MSKLANIAFIAAATGMAATFGASAAQSQTITPSDQPQSSSFATTYTQDGSARCRMSGGGPASRGEMSTSFANRYWSNMSCGQYERAQEILVEAPKAAPERGIPSILDTTSDFAKCYRASFAYSSSRYHNITEERNASGEVQTWVDHGFYRLRGENFLDIQRAVVAACDAKLNLD